MDSARPDGRLVPCHEAELTAAAVPLESVSGRPAAMQGGLLVDGVYDVASYRVFGVPPRDVLASSFRQTIVISAGGTQAKNIRIDHGGGVETTTWTVETSGSELRLTGVCPRGVDGAKETVEFGVQGDELVTRVEQAGLPMVVTYRRRGDG